MLDRLRALNSKTKKILIATIILMMALLTALGLVTFAYFSTRAYVRSEDGTEILRTGMKLDGFFDIINSDASKTQISNGTSLGIECTDSSITTGVTAADSDGKRYYTYNSSATWGSANNPYIISELRHFENLSVLQNEGFFDGITSKFADGTTAPEKCMPYFLVCTSDGRPALIDGSDMDHSYEPIGNDSHPFIGYVGGAFVSSSITVGGKSCDQSTIYNMQVTSTTDYVDVGLFGCIGYLGDDSGTATSFRGAASVVSDLLLYDIQVSVNEPTPWTKVADAIGHTFGFSDDPTSEIIAHENHHIGILTGHVEYTTLKYISVYYSSDDTVAIDVTHVGTDTAGEKANYMSNTGIVGFVKMMNSTSANGTITKDGTTDAELTISSGGLGSGGDVLSGTGRGYVTAKEIIDQYDDCGNIATYKVGENEYQSLLILANGSYGGSGTTYSLQDGTELTIVSVDGVPTARITTSYQGIIVPKTEYSDWTDFIVRYGNSGNYTYYHQNRTLVPAADIVEDSGIYLRFAAKYDSTDGTYKKLCTQYIRNRLIGDQQTTNRFYFYDGVFTFSLSSNNDKVLDTWKDNNPDSFTLGSTSTDNWKVNPAQGQHSIAAYVKQVTSSEELQDAANAKTPIFIMYRDGDTNALVTLAENSAYTSGDGDDALFTNLTKLNWMDDAAVSSLGTAFNDGAISTDQIEGKLNKTAVSSMSGYWDASNTKYRLLDISSSETDLTLNELKNYYNIDVKFTANTSATTFYKDDGVTEFKDGTVVVGDQIIEHKTQTFTGGIFYWTYYRDGISTWFGDVKNRFRYYYRTASGSVIKIQDSRTTKSPYEFFTSYTTNSNGIRIITYTYKGTTYTGPLALLEDGNYYAKWAYNNKVATGTYDLYKGEFTLISDPVSVSNNSIVYPYTVGHNYILAKVTESGTKYYFNGSVLLSGEPTEKTSGDSVQYDTINGNLYKLYTSGAHYGIKLITYEISGYYTFGNSYNGNYYLRILSRNYYANTRYSIMCSQDSYIIGDNFKVTNGLIGNLVIPEVKSSELATVTFNSDGSALIAYTLDGTTRYLGYTSKTTSGVTTNYFHGTSTSDSSTKVYIYTVEGTQDVAYGRTTFEPKAGTTSQTFSCANYVLWPDSLKNANTTYTVKQLEQNMTGVPVTARAADVLKKADGWRAIDGNFLKPTYLSKRFSLASSMSNVTVYGYGSTNFSIWDSEYVRAPIGTEGKETYIPTGCVAFRVNQSGENQKVRIIVSVPTTELYYQERDVNNNLYTTDNSSQLDYENNYFIGMWKVSEAGGTSSETISLDSVDTYFYLPRSAKYAPGTNPESANPAAITVNYNGTPYLCYLNGSRVLVAYEFSCNEEGVYLLGSNLKSDIIYFSADATASSGGDGTFSYKMGTVDYVYSNSSKVLTVKDTDKRDTKASGYTRDYSSYYYNSYSLLYTNNSTNPYFIANTGESDPDTTRDFPNVNDFSVIVHRVLSGNSAQLRWLASRDDRLYVNFQNYAINADTLVSLDP